MNRSVSKVNCEQNKMSYEQNDLSEKNKIVADRSLQGLGVAYNFNKPLWSKNSFVFILRLIRQLDGGMYRICICHMATVTMYSIFSIFITMKVRNLLELNFSFNFQIQFDLCLLLQFNSSAALMIIPLGIIQIMTFCFLGTLVSVSVCL